MKNAVLSIKRLFGALARRGALALGLTGLAPVAFGQTFSPAVIYLAGPNANPLAVALADLNGDGRRDIITANNGSSVVGVLLGTGNGAFGPVATTSTGPNTQPYDLAVADVNADGRPDVVTANFGTNSVSVLLGTGTGGFAPAVAYSAGVGSQPFGLTVADVNGDGRPDILSANTYSQSVGVLLGNGNGTFAAVVLVSTGTSAPVDVVVADVNADGKADLVTANANGNLIGVLLGNGNGTFQPLTTSALGSGNAPSGLAVADLNADGKPDVVASISFGNPSGTVGVLLGNGNGTFAAVAFYATGANSLVYGVAVADVSGDGKPDLITANPGSYTAGVLVGNGNGTFKPVTTFLAGGGISAPYGVAVADVNGDNKPDVVTSNVSTNTVTVLLNTSAVLAARPALLTAELTLSPNPTAATTAFAATNLPATVRDMELTLLNSLGQTVGRTTIAATQGTARAELPTAGLAAGIYLLRLSARDRQGGAVGTLPTQRLSVR